jgi:hypothetical protein
VSPTSPKQRGFVKNFETLILRRKRGVATVCKDLRMLRYQILEETRSLYDSTNAVYFFPALKKMQTTS